MMANHELFVVAVFLAVSLQQGKLNFFFGVFKVNRNWQCILIFISISLAFAIRCWQCSNIQGNCGDPFRDEYTSPASFIDCSLRSGGPFDSQFSQRLPYGQYNNQQWRQPWAQQQPQPLAQAQIWGQYGPSNRGYNQPVCVKAKSISE